MGMWIWIALAIGVAAVLFIILEYLRINATGISMAGLLLCLICIWLSMNSSGSSLVAYYLFWPGVFLTIMGILKNRGE